MTALKLVFDLDANRCSACGACAIACMDQNDIDPFAGDAPLRVVSPVEAGEKQGYLSVGCFHCDDAPCIVACPSGCLYKDEETGLTLYDTTYCIGCHSCAMACPFGAPTFGADGKMRKCDGCVTRIRCNLEPACVRNCPTAALRIYEEAVFEQQHTGNSLKKITKLLLD